MTDTMNMIDITDMTDDELDAFLEREAYERTLRDVRAARRGYLRREARIAGGFRVRNARDRAELDNG